MGPEWDLNGTQSDVTSNEREDEMMHFNRQSQCWFVLITTEGAAHISTGREPCVYEGCYPVYVL